MSDADVDPERKKSEPEDILVDLPEDYDSYTEEWLSFFQTKFGGYRIKLPVYFCYLEDAPSNFRSINVEKFFGIRDPLIEGTIIGVTLLPLLERDRRGDVVSQSTDPLQYGPFLKLNEVRNGQAQISLDEELQVLVPLGHVKDLLVTPPGA